jgi:inosose dehydratase
MPIQLASAPVTWGIFEFEGVTPRYSYDQVLDEMAATGYTGTELGPYGYLPTDPQQLASALAQRGLKLLSAFVPVALADARSHAAGEAAALQVGRLLAALGASHLVLADDNCSEPLLTVQAGQRTGSVLNEAGWDTFAAGVNRIARTLHNELGLKLVFHHHCGGYVETPAETRALLARTDPDLVGLCLDTGHWHFAGGDALACIAEFGQRVRYLHFKDYSPSIGAACRAQQRDYFAAVRAGVFCPLGEGEVDFAGVIGAMEKLGYTGWAIVEQDVLSETVGAHKLLAQANRNYLKGLGL